MILSISKVKVSLPPTTSASYLGQLLRELERDAYTGALFLFCNKAKDKLKLVYWDRTGFALWYKRLGATRSRFVYC
ncbi:IS66 family insertion sequence element accessory protein TnpB [Pseudoalteromonas sp. 2CM36K]|uniref:IS66 family insertion sequence element accessory protein TnpB n=1 Tax=Pseudoalteromonas sp. 2CM36K TaxID=2929854 RepID=UPI00289CA14A|nr:IS66 family insertion sequence element accessory protein TnpB [Pseudoalteromonas sp. 2CM36K]